MTFTDVKIDYHNDCRTCGKGFNSAKKMDDCYDCIELHKKSDKEISSITEMFDEAINNSTEKWVAPMLRGTVAFEEMKGWKIVKGNERRQKRIVIDPCFFAAIFKDGLCMKVVNGIPDGAEVVAFHCDPTNNTYHLIVRHESFPEAKEGEVIPEFTVDMETLSYEEANGMTFSEELKAL